jgi:hypothetical protein
MKTPRWRFTLRSSLVAVAVFALIAAGARSILLEPPDPVIPEGARLFVPTVASFVTAVAYSHETPPPWAAGNCFELSVRLRPARDHRVWGKHVVNMHYENFAEIVRRLGITTIEVQHVGGCFLVVDPRIPRRWLLESPCQCTLPPVYHTVLSKHPDKFRGPAARQ